MVEKLGGTRAVLAYLLVLGFIAACFASGISDSKFTALGTMTTSAVMFYYSNKATRDTPQSSSTPTTTDPGTVLDEDALKSAVASAVSGVIAPVARSETEDKEETPTST